MRLLISGLMFIVLVGCENARMTPVLLDTAPLYDSQLKHPEWAEAPATQSRNNAPSQSSQREADQFTQYLAQQGIPFKVVSGDHFIITLQKTINFNTGSSVVSPQSRQWLKQLSEHLAHFNNLDIVIDGHTDDTGTPLYNETLSQQRALKVKAELLNNAISTQHIFTRGYGEYVPACGNNTPNGKACNRRVEITLITSSNNGL